ncbi:4-hydroxyproline epimerase [Natronospira proteinivora]|uniref:4-hydroxyproline epimerase n=1 Tax=Natronospira proteinivora TaxID=1807133 RepID=A0ABT1G795_9GAMM|nr:4-hydroxyproline epimerase [Natronospira proteinivora]MCP1727174.1 4-hydroxyproline epimerase [Natronospira proteinivora]
MKLGTFFCIDAHTCGNPVRLVTSGYPNLRGRTMSEKRQDFLAHHDWIRQSLMFEPRGHAVMSGSLLLPPCSDDTDASVLFIETSGCLPMCGHGTIGTITAGIESGLLKPRIPGRVSLDVPAGRVDAEYWMEDERVDSVRIRNVASYLAHRDVPIQVEGLGELRVDIAYGGNFYAIVEPQANWAGLDRMSADEILHFSPLVRQAAHEAVECVHPDDPTVSGVSHTMWTDAPRAEGAHARNAVFYGERAIDRSPCGTGTSARMAQLAARDRLQPGEDFVHESIIGSLFHGRIEDSTRVGEHPAIIPSVKGWARITGHNTIFVDDSDPFWQGFEVR